MRATFTNRWNEPPRVKPRGTRPAQPVEREVDVPEGSAGVILSRLEEKGIVRHKGKYWAIERDDHLAGLSGMIMSTETLNEELGGEDISEWAEHAEGDVEEGL